MGSVLLGLLAALGLATRAQAKTPVFVVRPLTAPGRILDTAFLDADGDGREDLIVAHLDGDGLTKDERGVPIRYISLWKQGGPENRWNERPDLTRTVPSETVAFAVGDFSPAPGGEVALLGARDVSLMERDPRDGSPLSHLAPITSVLGFFDYPAMTTLPRWDLSPELGTKGKNDLLVPLKEGYLVLKNDPKLGLRPAATLKVPSRERFGPIFETKFLNRFLTYISNLPRAVAIDMNGDGRKDLVVYRKQGLARFLQKPDGAFGDTPDDEKPLSVVEDAGKRRKVQAQDGKGTSEAFANVRVSLVDLDKDGLADLVCTKTIGDIGVFESLRTEVLVWMGTRGGWNETRPDRILNQKGVTAEPLLVDWNGDGKLDLVLSSFRMDHFTNLKRAITKSISITYAIYVQNEGTFPDEPDWSKDVTVDLDVLERRNGAEVASFAADLDGDGFRDMVVRSDRNKLRVVQGGYEEGFFSGKSLAFKEADAAELDVPPNADIESRDLYKDRKGDVLILTNPAADDPERTRLRIIEVRR